jgi:hypothetical protein
MEGRVNPPVMEASNPVKLEASFEVALQDLQVVSSTR